MRSVIALTLVLLLSSLARGEERWDPKTTYVVMVGITEWKHHGEGNYKYDSFPKRGRMDAVLEKQLLDSGVPRENLVLLQDKDATLEAMRRETAAMAQRAKPGSTFIFYFNGHGDKDWRDGRHYLVNYDLDQRDFRKTGFAVSELSTIIEESFRGGRVLLLGDSCYSGAFTNVVDHFAGSKTIRAASLSSVVSENMAWATNSYSEDLVKIFAGDAAASQGGKVTLKSAASFLRDEMRFRENQPAEAARNEGFDADFVIRDVDPTTVLRTLPGRWQLRDFLEAKLDGKWYRAQIVDEKNGRYKVRFFAQTVVFSDAWLDADALRPAVLRDVKVGDAVQVRSTADWLKKPTWFDGVVTAVRDGFARVRYGDLPAFKAEWIPSSLLHYGEDRTAPPPLAGRGLNRVLEERIGDAREGVERAPR